MDSIKKQCINKMLEKNKPELEIFYENIINDSYLKDGIEYGILKFREDKVIYADNEPYAVICKVTITLHCNKIYSEAETSLQEWLKKNNYTYKRGEETFIGDTTYTVDYDFDVFVDPSTEYKEREFPSGTLLNEEYERGNNGISN